jgi:hypothetical protein
MISNDVHPNSQYIGNFIINSSKDAGNVINTGASISASGNNVGNTALELSATGPQGNNNALTVNDGYIFLNNIGGAGFKGFKVYVPALGGILAEGYSGQLTIGGSTVYFQNGLLIG